MISEGLCDTEDWSNDAGNSALHHRNKLQFTIYSNKCRLGEYYSLSKIFKHLTDPRLLNGSVVLLFGDKV